jgi:hypothetical protein
MRATATAVLRRVLPQELRGALDYYRFPGRRDGRYGPLNGQHARRAMFERIIAELPPAFVVETGTHRGRTTEFIASRVASPIYTVESDRRLHGFARVRLRRFPHVQLVVGDSREWLRRLASDGPARDAVGLFYLDAHGGAELPLHAELDLVCASWTRPIVIIDDFAVPDDSGYRFDDYGQAGCLTLDYIRPLVRRHELTCLFPVCPSSEESGARRGCVVLVRDPAHVETLVATALLRVWPDGD